MSTWDWVDKAIAKGERTNAALQQRIAALTAERDEWQRKCTDACYDAAALELRRSELDAENEQLRAALAAQWTPVIDQQDLLHIQAQIVYYGAQCWARLHNRYAICERRAPAQEPTP